MTSLRLRLSMLLIILFYVIGFAVPIDAGIAQTSANILWEEPRNISLSPENTSTDPFLLADSAGLVHLFWAEKVSSIPGNQPDTLMYTIWNGTSWARPLDLFFSPDSSGTPIIAYPHAVIDNVGRIHLFWLAQPNFPNYTLYYSSASANNSLNALEWTAERKLAEDLTGTKYSFAVQFREPNEIHLIYARVQQGDGLTEERAITYLKSSDYGETWSDPLDIHTFKYIQTGGSDTRMALDSNGRIYTTWTEWDETGRGFRVWFARSLDNGISWEKPVILSERIQNEYERDWANLAVLDEGQIVVMWEGGWRAYRNAQYSEDGGANWSSPIDTYPWLIGENGFVEFARDSNGTLHAFIAQRVREGYVNYGDTDREGLWHSIWLKERNWSEPVLSNGLNAMINPKVVIFKGNEVMAAWYAPPTFEIITMKGKIQNTPPLPTQIISQIPTLQSTPPALNTIEESSPTFSASPEPTLTAIIDEPIPSSPNTPTMVLIIGVIPVVGLLMIAFYLKRHSNQK
jgi:hypothetical protein